MPKNEDQLNLEYDREDNRADSKNHQQNDASILEEKQELTNNTAADYVPSLNGISKNKV
ncbi:hypothetical protein ACFPES_14445 [Paenibacillus sp. GCM10023248]|uniref:hypothetical protein n=1 Tax=Bacillales TaxID=1385 RepID=UPI00237870E3|nr:MULTISPECIES: hypothetical protein [Bacillales]MDD9268235.1 hypothetical protein [Paenibacillus sp. MAHUQ-63]MDR6879912.1 hypothetical protein [Bacillus sp. 3255]